MLQSIEVKGQKIMCAHWKTFPPVGMGEDPEAQRAGKTITEAQYNQLKIWERVCGLTEMSESKCPQCPHHRQIKWKTRGPVMVSPDGVETPVIDMAAGESAPRNR